ncbi:DUF3618 domain-containing protein [Agrococcus sediminis]|jgi:gas vesicle protein|uniref:DUF3618 domain-containing protein n=1 Tax=Agrococcus TaxID=46352 RepID=UPI000FE2BC1F|nr:MULTISPECIES: DUF3618 domain-containing protein [unclassified Agrococcus]MDR7234004.1 gas vesicle protein [Agrococcus sp. BE272]RWR16297.1 DUF3618 domain-containing protein [Agrococcus lahaulensis]UOW01524.1 DUF3618 domain-containing protein [Agrococcus sp. SCSIO52902]
MNETPEEIRARIERTRAEVSGDVDALGEKVSPSGMVGRQTERIKGRFGDVKDRVFGVDDHDPGAVGRMGDDVQGAIGHAGESVRDGADRAVRKAKGNPLAVGLIAFGVGALVASLIPASDKEKEVASKVKEGAQPLVDGAKDVAQEMGEHLKEPAQQAAQSVKDTAQQAGEHIKGDAQSAAKDVQDDAQRARQHVQDEAQR